jgi:hypothetical protein
MSGWRGPMKITFGGRTQNANAWAREIGVSYHLLRWRLQHWTLDRALTTAKRPHSKPIDHNGRTQNLTAWARDLGITTRTLRERLRRGEAVEMALQERRGRSR